MIPITPSRDSVVFMKSKVLSVFFIIFSVTWLKWLIECESNYPKIFLKAVCPGNCILVMIRT